LLVPRWSWATHFEKRTREAAEKKVAELRDMGCFEVEIVEEAEAEVA
jgi:hypothetical protein